MIFNDLMASLRTNLIFSRILFWRIYFWRNLLG